MTILKAAEARKQLLAQGRYSGLRPGKDWKITRKGSDLTIRFAAGTDVPLDTVTLWINWARAESFVKTIYGAAESLGHLRGSGKLTVADCGTGSPSRFDR